MRLQGSFNDHKGLVEVFVDQTWRPLCSYGWSIEDANVVCTELGYNTALEAVNSTGEFGESRGPVWLEKLDCLNESSVRFCHSSPIGIHGCTSEYVPGTHCGIGKFFFFLSVSMNR